MNRKQNRKRKKTRQKGRQLSHAPRCAPLGGQIAAAHSSSTPCTARTSFPVFVFFRKRVAREEEGERELSSSRALSPCKNLKKKKKNLEKKNPPPRTGFVIALNSSAFPLGSLKNIVHCSPGCPSNRSRGPSSHRIPAAATLAASSRNSGTESARPKCGTGTGSPSTAEAADLAS